MYSIEDVSKNLEATDNYLEKYFPVKMQELINQAFKHFATTHEETEKVLDYEIEMYKKFHLLVIKDQGLSSLDKGNKDTIIPNISKLEK